MTKYCIYELQTKDGIPFYVGKTSVKRLAARKFEHISESNNNRTRKSNKIKSILKKGEYFKIVPIAFSESEDEIYKMEINLITSRKNLCNHTDGGEGLRNPSTETRKKMADNARRRFSGKGNPSCRDEVRMKRAKFLKENNPMFNKEIKQKAILKIRESCAKKVVKYDLNMNLLEDYVSIREAAKMNNVGKEGISNCCRNKLKTSGGYIWKFSVEGRVVPSDF